MTAAVRAADWRTSAACLTADPALFVGPDGETVAAQARREAKATQVCDRCPLLARFECLSFANRTGTEYGVFGGLGEDERRSLRRRHRRTALQARGA